MPGEFLTLRDVDPSRLSAAAEIDRLRRLNAIDALALLVEDFGAASVHTWLRSIAALKGQDLPCRRDS